MERWEKADSLEDKRMSRRFEPSNKLTQTERDSILRVANSARFCDLPPCQIVPILADEGMYLASESTFYRVLKGEGQLVHRHKSQPRRYLKPKALVATRPNQVWSWDITYLPSGIKGAFYYLCLIVDIYSRKIVGWTVSERETSQVASDCVNRACQHEKIAKAQVTLHSDNGGALKGATLLVTLRALGIATTYSRPGVSNDNPFSESLFRTLKYQALYPNRPFHGLTEAMAWVNQLVHWYNTEHRHSAIGFVTPHQKHTGDDVWLLAQRRKTYESARLQNPSRWSRKTRDWTPVTWTCLNPNKRMKEQLKRISADQTPALMHKSTGQEAFI